MSLLLYCIATAFIGFITRITNAVSEVVPIVPEKNTNSDNSQLYNNNSGRNEDETFANNRSITEVPSRYHPIYAKYEKQKVLETKNIDLPIRNNPEYDNQMMGQLRQLGNGDTISSNLIGAKVNAKKQIKKLDEHFNIEFNENNINNDDNAELTTVLGMSRNVKPKRGHNSRGKELLYKNTEMPGESFRGKRAKSNNKSGGKAKSNSSKEKTSSKKTKSKSSATNSASDENKDSKEKSSKKTKSSATNSASDENNDGKEKSSKKSKRKSSNSDSEDNSNNSDYIESNPITTALSVNLNLIVVTSTSTLHTTTVTPSITAYTTVDASTELINTITTALSITVSTISTTSSVTINTITTAPSVAINTIPTTSSNAVNTITTTLSDAVKSITTTPSDAVNTIGTTPLVFVNTITTTSSDVVNTITNSPSYDINTITTSPSVIVNMIATTIQFPLQDSTLQTDTTDYSTIIVASITTVVVPSSQNNISPHADIDPTFTAASMDTVNTADSVVLQTDSQLSTSILTQANDNLVLSPSIQPRAYDNTSNYLIQKYTGCYERPSDAYEALKSELTLCKCPTGQMVDPTDGKCIKLNTANVQLHVTHICNVKLDYLDGFKSPTSDHYREIGSVLVAGIQQTLDKHALPLHVCIPKKPMKSGSVVVETSYNCSSSEECSIDKLGAALQDKDAPVKVDASGLERTSCGIGHEQDCHSNATCYVTGYNYYCLCKPGYKDESSDEPTGKSCVIIRCEHTKIFNLCLPDWAIGLMLGGMVLLVGMCVSCRCCCNGDSSVSNTKKPKDKLVKVDQADTTTVQSNDDNQSMTTNEEEIPSPVNPETPDPILSPEPPDSEPPDPTPTSVNANNFVGGSYIRVRPEFDTWEKVIPTVEE